MNPHITWLGQSSSTRARLFQLHRDEDETGVSGTGHVADGVQFADGVCVVRWRTKTTSTAVYNSIAEVIMIHGHGGKTRVVWVSP